MSSQEVLYQVSEVIEDRKMNPQEGSYTNYLFDKGLDKILKKVGEEATETIIAAKNQEKEEIVYEIADLIYHLTVLMAVTNITWDDILSELARRELKKGNLKLSDKPEKVTELSLIHIYRASFYRKRRQLCENQRTPRLYLRSQE